MLLTVLNVSLLRFKAMHYPDNWRFKDPDTGAEFHGKSKQALLNHIVTYRSQNQLPAIESLDVVVENYICGLPANAGGCLPMELKRGVLAYVKGGVALVKNVLLGKLVGQKEADRRGAICIECPHNVFPDKKGFIAWSDQIAEIQIGKQKSAHHNELGNCEVCTCPLRVKVWLIPPFNLPADQQAVMRKDKPDCWQLAENQLKDRCDVEK